MWKHSLGCKVPWIRQETGGQPESDKPRDWDPSWALPLVDWPRVQGMAHKHQRMETLGRPEEPIAGVAVGKDYIAGMTVVKGFVADE